MGTVTVIATVVTAIIAGVVAAILGLFSTVNKIFAALLRTILKVLYLPLKLCIGDRDPPSPLGFSYLPSFAENRFTGSRRSEGWTDTLCEGGTSPATFVSERR